MLVDQDLAGVGQLVIGQTGSDEPPRVLETIAPPPAWLLQQLDELNDNITHALSGYVDRTCVPGRAAAMGTTNMERAGRRPVTEDVLMRLFEELTPR